MNRTLIVACLALFASACVVVSPSGLRVVDGDPKHPHGGPPGQTKKMDGHKHKHGKKCGHSSKKHKGKVVYVVDDRHEDEDGLVIVIRD